MNEGNDRNTVQKLSETTAQTAAEVEKSEKKTENCNADKPTDITSKQESVSKFTCFSNLILEYLNFAVFVYIGNQIYHLTHSLWCGVLAFILLFALDLKLCVNYISKSQDVLEALS